MQKSNFVDYVKLYLTSGKGGSGAMSFRREKYVPHGGPDGGDGGAGGNIYLRGNRNLWTLLDLKYRKYIKAGAGSNGSGARRNGKTGKHITLEAPIGTVAYNAETGEPLGEIMHDGDTILLVKGGRGGLGNWNFRTPTNQAPEFAQAGEPAQEVTVILELKLLADVGLVGFPNAGKSTLLAALTAAKPEIADYPFTTLTPNLGIVRHRDFNSFVIADIPGIIEGASEGRGLGVTFLRHIERNAVLLFLVRADEEDPVQQYKILLQELENYEPELIDKPRLLAISQCDIVFDEMIDDIQAAFREYDPALKPVMISAVTGMGLIELKDALWALLNKEDEEAPLLPRQQSNVQF